MHLAKFDQPNVHVFFFLARPAHNLGEGVWIDTQISQYTTENRENPLFFIKWDRFSLKITAKSWMFTISQWCLGNLGVDPHHPLNLRAGLLLTMLVERSVKIERVETSRTGVRRGAHLKF